MIIDLENFPGNYIEYATNEINFIFEVAERLCEVWCDSLVIDLNKEYVTGTFNAFSNHKQLFMDLSSVVEVNETIIDTENSTYEIIVNNY